MGDKIEIVIPCYNEEECVSIIYQRLHEIGLKIPGYTLSMLFIDDGSKDKTLEEIKKIERSCNNDEVHHLSFSRNFGKEAAIFAGLKKSTGDYVVLMDADLQHPPELLYKMVNGIEEGYECCAARRVSRNGEPPIRSAFSRMFYYLINKVTSLHMQQGATDFRMMSRKFINAVLEISEKNRFTKGIFSWVGFKTKWIEYENVERAAGTTKWSFGGLIGYAVSGFLSFATTPLRGAVYLGFLVMAAAFLYALIIVIATLTGSGERSGYASIITLILFLGGIIIMLLGVIGEYLARIYIEVKNRPIFIESDTNLENEMKNQDDAVHMHGHRKEKTK